MREKEPAANLPSRQELGRPADMGQRASALRTGTPSSILPGGRLRSAVLGLAVVATLPLFTACGPGEPTAAGTATAVQHTPSATATEEPTVTPTPSYEDTHEPNDSMLQASGPLEAGREYEGFISEKDDIDYFYLEIETPQAVELRLTDMPPEADYDLLLVTREEDILDDSSNPGQQDEHIEYTTSSVGMFYVLVLPFHSFSRTEPYTLRLGLAPAPTPSGEDTYEPNDTLEQAAGPLIPGQAYQSYVWDEGDVDVYVFQLDRGTTMRISLAGIPTVADFDLFLYNEDGDILASSTRVVDRETIEQPLQPGTYYAAVQSFAGFSQNEPYTLTINAVEP